MFNIDDKKTELYETTKKYVAFFERISSHSVARKNKDLSQLTELCIALSLKVDKTASIQEHEAAHALLKKCLKNMRGIFRSEVENKKVNVYTLHELMKNKEELKLYIANFDKPDHAHDQQANLAHEEANKSKVKSRNDFRKFLESGKPHELPEPEIDMELAPTNGSSLESEMVAETIKVIQHGHQETAHARNESLPQNEPSERKAVVIYFICLFVIAAAWTAVHFIMKTDQSPALAETPAAVPKAESKAEPAEKAGAPAKVAATENFFLIDKSEFAVKNPAKILLLEKELAESKGEIKLKFKVQSDVSKARFSGRVVLLTRGPRGIHAHPEAALSMTAGVAGLIPGKGIAADTRNERWISASIGDAGTNRVEFYFFDEKNRLVNFKLVKIPSRTR